MSIENDDVERRVQEALNEVCQRADRNSWGAARWTREVKEALSRVAKGVRYFCNASGCDGADGGEWLFDVTWTKYDGNYLVSVPLVCESQWGTGPGRRGVNQDFVNDFEKLLAARAEHKLMVLESLKADTVESTIDTLIERIKRFGLQVDGERYMFACWVNEHNRFTFKTHVT